MLTDTKKEWQKEEGEETDEEEKEGGEGGKERAGDVEVVFIYVHVMRL